MKKKSRHATLKRKHEFRYHPVLALNKRGKLIKFDHPAYVFLQKGNVYVYAGITHSKKVPNKTVVKFRKNPNPKDRRDAYFVAEAKEDTTDRFGRKHDDWIIDPLDDEDIRNLYKTSNKKR